MHLSQMWIYYNVVLWDDIGYTTFGYADEQIPIL